MFGLCRDSGFSDTGISRTVEIGHKYVRYFLVCITGNGNELLKSVSTRISTFSSNTEDVLAFSELINNSRTQPYNIVGVNEFHE